MKRIMQQLVHWAAASAWIAGCEAAPATNLAGEVSKLEINGECLIGDETLEHACLHATFGPFASVTAQPYPGFVFTDINAPHTAFTVNLPASTSGFEGAVLYQPTASGQFALLVDQQVELTLFDSGGSPLAPVGSAPGDAALCPEIAHIETFVLSDAETYVVLLRAMASAPLVMVEYLGQEVSCGPACEPITLSASRTYCPSAWEDAELNLDHHVVFEIPSHLSVTEGSAGTYGATLTFSADGQQVECKYRGNGADRYEFRRCNNGAQAGEDAEADYFSLHVQRGANDGPNERTTVELTILPECEGDHDHEEEE